MIELLAALAVGASTMQSGERPVGKLTVKHPEMCRTLAEREDAERATPAPHGRQQRPAPAGTPCHTERHKLPKPEPKPEA
ncbi:hypothetical protein S2M10_40990 [Sphingomonas sp. S2M10]|uniref:hypothetical protein n=1 Tax=Sphingomonas sp. S2M10 TaxID=2705010 RepID=UPI0014577EE3|nr:hypothetical protein [Sphingomonas sp. S2M10]NLS29083.1 hypothetical protein [Sphingomonas sp. S2M10]